MARTITFIMVMVAQHGITKLPSLDTREPATLLLTE
jgi:hypothetical protein